MGLTKSEMFTDSQNELAAILRVFAHPARLAILEFLQKSNQCICGDIVEEIGLAQPTISQHLKELKAIGVIKGNISGTSICYCIDHNKIETIKSMFLAFFNNSKCC